MSRPGRSLGPAVLTVVALLAPATVARAQAYGPPVSPGQTLRTADMTSLQPLLPGDIYRPSGVRGADHADLATFAWLELIALAAPVGAARGTAGGSFAQSGANVGDTLVWETFHHRIELLPGNAGGAVPPQPWNSAPTYVYNPPLKVPSGVHFGLYNNLDEASQIAQNLLFFPRKAGDPRPNEDWQVLFEAKVSRAEVDFVAQNYNRFTIAYNPFRFTPPITLPTGTVEVKGAWKPIAAIPPGQRHRYHTANVLYYTGSDSAPVAQNGEYALIGLHIIHKTPNYPSFIFATFEHVDNLRVDGAGTGLYYVPAYTTITYEVPATTTFPATGTVYTNPTLTLPDGSTFDPAKPYAAPDGVLHALPVGSVGSIPGARRIPVSPTATVYAVPVTEPVPISPATARVNAQALAAMRGIPGFDERFVWQYYRLAGVQAVPTSDETGEDFYLANNVIESSQPGVQLFRGSANITTGTPVLTNTRNQLTVQDAAQGNRVFAPGGCQGCHGVAQTQNGFDFNFLFFGANGNGFSPDTLGVKSVEEMGLRAGEYRGSSSP